MRDIKRFNLKTLDRGPSFEPFKKTKKKFKKRPVSDREKIQVRKKELQGLPLNKRERELAQDIKKNDLRNGEILPKKEYTNFLREVSARKLTLEKEYKDLAKEFKLSEQDLIEIERKELVEFEKDPYLREWTEKTKQVLENGQFLNEKKVKGHDLFMAKKMRQKGKVKFLTNEEKTLLEKLKIKIPKNDVASLKKEIYKTGMTVNDLNFLVRSGVIRTNSEELKVLKKAEYHNLNSAYNALVEAFESGQLKDNPTYKWDLVRGEVLSGELSEKFEINDLRTEEACIKVKYKEDQTLYNSVNENLKNKGKIKLTEREIKKINRQLEERVKGQDVRLNQVIQERNEVDFSEIINSPNRSLGLDIDHLREDFEIEKDIVEKSNLAIEDLISLEKILNGEELEDGISENLFNKEILLPRERDQFEIGSFVDSTLFKDFKGTREDLRALLKESGYCVSDVDLKITMMKISNDFDLLETKHSDLLRLEGVDLRKSIERLPFTERNKLLKRVATREKYLYEKKEGLLVPSALDGLESGEFSRGELENILGETELNPQLLGHFTKIEREYLDASPFEKYKDPKRDKKEHNFKVGLNINGKFFDQLLGKLCEKPGEHTSTIRQRVSLLKAVHLGAENLSRKEVLEALIAASSKNREESVTKRMDLIELSMKIQTRNRQEKKKREEVINKNLTLSQEGAEALPIPRGSLTKKTIDKIAIDDFNLSEEEVKSLHKRGFFEEDHGYDNKFFEIFKGRELQNPKHYIESIDYMRHAVNGEYERFIGASKNYKPRLSKWDIGLMIKIQEDLPLSSNELRRKVFLNAMNYRKDGSKLLNMINNPKGGHFRSVRNKVLNEEFSKKVKLNVELVKFVNKFKQVEEKTLLNMGVSSEELSKLSEGYFPKGHKIYGLGKILNREEVQTGGKSHVIYSINHEGDVSGRNVLENHIKSKDVAKKIQGRKDLLAHDLKVVDSVNLVISKLKKEGYKIVDVKNEATIQSESKKGIKNDYRNSIDLGYMDAVIEVEKEVQGGGSVKKTIGVEFGDYSLSRMRKKLNEAVFDEGYVFSSPSYQRSYMKHIDTGRNVSFLTL